MPAAWVGAATGAIGLVNSMNSQPQMSGSNSIYRPGYSSGADTLWNQNGFQGQQNLTGLSSQTQPAIQQSFNQSQGINYSPYLQASQQAGQQYGGLANQAAQAGQLSYGQAQGGFGQQQNLQNTGNQFYGQQQQLAQQAQMAGYGANAQQQQYAQGLQQAGQQVYNTAFDPQQALYQQQFQQNQDQTNAVTSQYGLGSSAAGAGIANQSNQNFNTNWQAQQLARQSQGLSALSGADQSASGISATGYGALNQGLTSAGQFGTQGTQGLSSLNQTGIQSGNQGSANLQAGLGYYGQQPGYTQQSAQVPLNAQQYAAAQPGLNATTYASQVGQAMAPYQAQQNSELAYLTGSTSAQNNAYASQLAGQNAANQGLYSAGQTLGNVNWGQLSSAFNTPSYTTGTQTGGNSSLYSDYGYG